MRQLAGALLVLMSVIYLTGRLAPATWKPGPYLAAFGEAGMVGAIADWFAVTALFRHPLGLPIPHTAIIPRNKDRIGAALGRFISHNFLEPRLLDRRLLELEPARRIAEWLSDPRIRDIIARRIADLAPEIIKAGPALADLAAEGVRRLASAGPLAPTAARVLDYLWRETATPALIDRAMVALGEFAAARPELFEAAVEARTWAWLPKWVDRAVAERLRAGIVSTLEEMRSRDHPLRAALDTQVEALISRLATDPDYFAKGEELKARLLADQGLVRSISEACADAARRWAAEPDSVRELVEEAAGRSLTAAGRWLTDDRGARERLDLWIRAALRRTVIPGRQAIGEFVAQVVAGWDARAVADRLELQVGRDLQFIRINGALVGALVGLAIFAASRLLD
ncbi:MAG TPA: DUF445 domain-containing protein [Caulobacteraceae bacterium]|jgi:uncharacterized membrane-anchored protein YjiN (DUF445 family)